MKTRLGRGSLRASAIRQDRAIAVPTAKPLIPPATWQWLCRYTGFPARRLERPAELLVLLAAAAQEADSGPSGAGATRLVRQDARQAASQRQQAENRRKTHFKSNNRTKV
jgi:hypothetical protein